MSEQQEIDFSGFVIKSVEIVSAYSSMFTPDGPFIQLPTMFARVHYQDGDVGEMLFDPVGVQILLEAVIAYYDSLSEEDLAKFNEYVKAMGKNVVVTEEPGEG